MIVPSQLTFEQELTEDPPRYLLFSSFLVELRLANGQLQH